MYTQRQAAKLSGVAQAKLSRLKAKGVIVPDLDGDKYSAELVEKIRLEYGKNTGIDSDETVTADDTPANVVDTATSAQEALQATIDAVDDQTPADVQNAAKIDDSTSIDKHEDFAEASPTLVEENLAAVTIDVEAEIVTLDQRADRIRELNFMRDKANVAIDIAVGRELAAAKAEIGYGNWAEWLKENFEWTRQTANNFMRVAERFGKCKNVFQFKRSQLQALLALPVGSEDEFIAQQAEEGKPVEEMSARDVKDAVKEFNRQRNGGLEENFGLVQSTAPETNDNTTDEIIPETISTAENDDGAAVTSQKKIPPINFNHNGTQEYYTPSKYIEAARRVFGGTIDLDPASCALANETVKAEKFFSIDDDGLSQKWHGRIWMNPPYDKDIIPRFIDKLLTSDIEAAIVLVPCRTDRPWFKALANFSNAIVFSDHRVKCLRNGVDDDSSGPTCGSAIFYIGDDAENFFAEFEQFGFGVYPRKKIRPLTAGRKDNSNE